jgi:hypothetical protein
LRDGEGLLASAFPLDKPAASTSRILALWFKPISVCPWPVIIINRVIAPALSDTKQNNSYMD